MQSFEWSPRLLELEAELRSDLPDEPDVIARVARAIRKNAAGVCNPSTPLGRFLLVGSNEKARRLGAGLARFLFGDIRRMIGLDMKDYSEKHQICRLYGHFGGFFAETFPGELTEPIWHHPQTVVLIEMIEDAHWDACKC